MSIPTVIKHTDAGSIPFYSRVGSVNEVMKDLLPRLGWTIFLDDTDNHKTIFHNNSFDGPSCFIQFTDDETSIPGNMGRTAFRLQAYQNMSDFDNGVNLLADSFYRKHHSTSHGSNTPIEYYIIGDDRTFYFGFNSERPFAIAAGDYIGYIPGMPNVFCSIGDPGNTNNSNDGATWPAPDYIGISLSPASLEPQLLMCSMQGLRNTTPGASHPKQVNQPRVLSTPGFFVSGSWVLGKLRGVSLPCFQNTHSLGDELMVTDGYQTANYMVLMGANTATTGSPSYTAAHISLGDWGHE